MLHQRSGKLGLHDLLKGLEEQGLGPVSYTHLNIFGDPQLNRLVSSSLNNNPDMKVARRRIREARERLRVSQASLLPSADASAGWSLSPPFAFASFAKRMLNPG